MNRKRFIGLVILMGISLLGIIGVQLIWMRNALKVKNELFERGVTRALITTVEQLDRMHNMGVVNELMFSESAGRSPHPASGAHVFSGFPDSLKRNPVTIIRQTRPGNRKTTIGFSMNTDSSENGMIQYEYESVHSVFADDSNLLVLHNPPDTVGDLIWFRDTLQGDVDSLITLSVERIDSLETDLDTLFEVAPDFSKSIKVKTKKLKNIASRVVTEVVSWDAFEADPQRINETLKKALAEQQIPIAYEFGVLRDSIPVEQSESADSLLLVHSPFQASLYPSNLFARNLILSVYFPRQESFIFRSVNWLLILSFVFSLIILLTFALSIHYILRQKKISEMKSDFINNMTHEFKTPIATISLAADSATNEKVIGDPERVRYFLGMIKKENTRMNRQVEDILTIARLDKKEFDFAWEPVDLHALINRVIEGISLQVEKRSGKIQTFLEASHSVVMTDKTHGANIIYNLLDNAIKYSVDPPEITLTTKESAKGVTLCVRDQGMGMTKAVQGKIFEKFYRLSGGNIHNVKGFGLGLSYVKAVVEANQGNISVQSEPGKGSIFCVFLPYIRENR